jgi:acyl-CoA thioester hydrolase
MVFEKIIEVRWADVDQNGHVRHSAYYDYGAHIRVACLTAAGYDTGRMVNEDLGPILFHEECTFLREIKSSDTVTINMLIGDMRDDGSRWNVHHELFNAQGQKLAHLSIKGAWMDLKERKLCSPPQAIRDAFAALEPGERFIFKKS